MNVQSLYIRTDMGLRLTFSERILLSLLFYTYKKNLPTLFNLYFRFHDQTLPFLGAVFFKHISRFSLFLINRQFTIKSERAENQRQCHEKKTSQKTFNSTQKRHLPQLKDWIIESEQQTLAQFNIENLCGACETIFICFWLLFFHLARFYSAWYLLFCFSFAFDVNSKLHLECVWVNRTR